MRLALRCHTLPTTLACKAGLPCRSTALSSWNHISLTRIYKHGITRRTLSSSHSTYDGLYNQSLLDPQEFWLQQSTDDSGGCSLQWDSAEGPALKYNSTEPHDYQWFPDHTLNTCFNCIDVHVNAGRGAQTAVIYDSPVTNTIQHISYQQLLERVSALASALHQAGVRRGDVVLLYLPMIPEAVYSMLACARLGVIHSVVFGGFAAAELSKRIVDCQPKVIITASCGVEPTRVVAYKPIVDEAIKMSQVNPTAVVVVQRERLTVSVNPAELSSPRDVEYSSFARQGSKPGVIFPPVSVRGTDPLYLLYTSGTTGMPKGVVRDNGGHAVAMKHSLYYLFGMRRGETWWAASDIGWVVGHSYIIYAPLLSGCTTILYEGKPVGTPDAGAFWRVIQQHKVKALFAAPTALRSIKKEDSQGELIAKYNLREAGFRTMFLAGERGDPDTIQWGQKVLKVPVVDNYWQTESGWPIICNPSNHSSSSPAPLYPIKPGSAAKPTAGFKLTVLDDSGVPIQQPSHEGNLALQLPLPPGCLTTLWHNPARYKSSYLTRFPGYYDTSDSGHVDEQGYVYIMSRTDDVMNVAGHRLSSGAMEEVLARHSAVAEAAVVGQEDALKGQVPAGFVVLKTQHSTHVSAAALRSELIAAIRTDIGPIASFHHVYIARRLPKTRSGKILRNVLRALLDGQPVKVPPTIEDITVVDELKTVIAEQKQTKAAPQVAKQTA